MFFNQIMLFGQITSPMPGKVATPPGYCKPVIVFLILSKSDFSYKTVYKPMAAFQSLKFSPELSLCSCFLFLQSVFYAHCFPLHSLDFLKFSWIYGVVVFSCYGEQLKGSWAFSTQLPPHVAQGRPLVGGLCLHGPVLPALLDELGRGGRFDPRLRRQHKHLGWLLQCWNLFNLSLQKSLL